MSTKNEPLVRSVPFPRDLPSRKWLAIAIAAGALFLIAFYAITDGSWLAHDRVLDGADWVGYAVCHRITTRSFSVAGRQLPLCARCTGMYLGVTLAFVVLTLAGRLKRSEMPPLKIGAILLVFVATMGVDGINSYLHFFPDAPYVYGPRNWLRLVTGMGTGLAMGIFVMPALAQTLWGYRDVRPILSSLQELGGLLLIAGILIALVLSNDPTLLYILALASAAGVLIVLATVQTVLLLIILGRDGKTAGWIGAAAPLSAGLILTIAEIGAISVLRFNLTGTMTGFPGL